MATLNILTETIDFTTTATTVKLRARPSRDFVAADGTPVTLSSMLEIPCTKSTRTAVTGEVIPTLVIPEFQITSTRDALVGRSAYWIFDFIDGNGIAFAYFSGFEKVSLPALFDTGTDVEWFQIRQFNAAPAPLSQDRSTYSREQIDAKIAAGIGTVASVFGRTGDVIAVSGDYTWAQINKAVSSLADITTRSHTLLSDIGTNTHAQIDTHIASTANPHSVTKTQVGLGNVDNTSDLNKPISTATQTALDGKSNVGHTHDHTLLSNIGTNTHAQIDTHIASTSNPHSVTKTQVGLGNVPNVDATNASNISAGTLVDARLSSNVPLKNASNTFTSDNTFIAPNASTTSLQVNSAAGAVGARVDTFKVVVDGTTAFTVGYGNTSGSFNNRFVQTAMPLHIGNDNDPLIDYAGNYFHGLRHRSLVSGDPNSFDKWEGITSWMNLSGLTGPTSGTQDFYAYNGECGVNDTGNTHNVWTIYGAYNVAFVKGSGIINDGLIGVMGKGHAYGSGTVAKHRGSQGWAASITGATGTSTLAQGVYGLISNDASGYTMTTAVAVDGLLNSNSGTIGNAYVIRARAETSGAGTVTGNRYGVYIANQTGVGTVSGTAYNLYSEGATSKNFFEGIVILSQLNDSNSNELLKFTGVASAVNELTVTNAATGNRPTITSTGGDTNIGIGVQAKGSGVIRFGTASDTTSYIEVSEFGILSMITSGTAKAVLNGAGGGNSSFFRVSNDGQFGFTDGLNVNTTSVDTGLARQAAGVVRISNGSTGTGNILAGQYLFSTGISPVGLFFGSGSPEGVLTAGIGSIYLRTNGGAGTSIYVKESGSGNTGWVAK